MRRARWTVAATPELRYEEQVVREGIKICRRQKMEETAGREFKFELGQVFKSRITGFKGVACDERRIEAKPAKQSGPMPCPPKA